jgi:excinuclease ABC subunit A
LHIPVPLLRRPLNFEKGIEVRKAAENNLKRINVLFPLGGFICVTGVSGSGKSTLVSQILLRGLRRKLSGGGEKPGKHDRITGDENIYKIVEISQRPIGRTPRSNPATYTGAFTPIRELFAMTKNARIRGYTSSRFSFNVKGGRCEACRGQGTKKIEMHFLPDVFVRCEACKGSRFNRETLEIRYRGRNIADVLDMRIEEALRFFTNHRRIRKIFQTLYDVGLGYMRLGQPSTTLSGGEAQRVKLSSELTKGSAAGTLYIMDEPTIGLHFADISRLLDVINRIVEKGGSFVVIEHHMDVIKTADWVIDLGPGGGEEGGTVMATGTPEDIARVSKSATGRYLVRVLNEK